MLDTVSSLNHLYYIIHFVTIKYLKAYIHVYRHMIKETIDQTGKESPAFVDPAMMTINQIESERSEVVKHLVKVMRVYESKEIIMFAYNPGGH